jgi:hypothetical protein
MSVTLVVAAPFLVVATSFGVVAPATVVAPAVSTAMVLAVVLAEGADIGVADVGQVGNRGADVDVGER